MPSQRKLARFELLNYGDKTLGRHRQQNMDLYLACSGWKFALGVIMFIAAVIAGSASSLISLISKGGLKNLIYPYHTFFLLDALKSPTVLFCIPLICAFPYTASFVDEYSNGFIKNTLPRLGYHKYSRNKVLATGLSGGLALLTGIFMSYLILMLVFSPLESKANISQTTFAKEQSAMSDKVGNNGDEAGSGTDSTEPVDSKTSLNVISNFIEDENSGDVATIAARYFLSGIFWSLVGGTFAALSLSKYLAYLSPFVIYYFLIILCERYMNDIYVLHPQNWLLDTSPWPGGAWGLALFLMELILITSVGFYACIRKRIAYD